MSNRVTVAVERAQARIAELEAEGKTAELEQLDAELAVDFGEHFAYQQAQARAHAKGLLTPDEAQVVYQALGEVGSADNGGWAAGTGLATKVAVTMLMGQLLLGR